jgi:hypothetical protein
MHAPKGPQARGAYYKVIRSIVGGLTPAAIAIMENNPAWCMFIPVLAVLGKSIRTKWPNSAPWVVF